MPGFVMAPKVPRSYLRHVEHPWIPIRRFEGHAGAIYDAAWHPVASAFLTAGGDGTVARWSTAADDGTAVFHHSRAFFCVTPWGDGLIAGTEDGEVFSCSDPGAADIRRTTAHRGGVFTVLPAGSHVLTGGGDSSIRLWAATPGEPWSLEATAVLENAGKIRHLAFRPGALLAATSGGTAWEFPWPPAPDGAAPPPADLGTPARVTHHPGGCHAAVWHAQKGLWMTGGKDGIVRATAPDGTEVIHFAAHAGTVYRLLLHDGVLYSAGRDKTVKAWDARDLRPLARTTPAHGGPVRSVNALAAGPEGLLSGGDDRIARLLPFVA
jgi:WD40 repeat protein